MPETSWPWTDRLPADWRGTSWPRADRRRIGWLLSGRSLPEPIAVEWSDLDSLHSDQYGQDPDRTGRGRCRSSCSSLLSCYMSKFLHLFDAQFHSPTSSPMAPFLLHLSAPIYSLYSMEYLNCPAATCSAFTIDQPLYRGITPAH